MDKLFWVDSNKAYTYNDILNDLNQKKDYQTAIFEKNGYDLWLSLIHSMIYDYPVILIDSDFSDIEIKALEIDKKQFQKHILKKQFYFNKITDIFSQINNIKNWSLTLFTSGTTGLPKKVKHSYFTITRSSKLNSTHWNDIWGFAYNPTHMAGIQVFFQAFLNKNTMINVFGKTIEEIKRNINKYKITHISATPTFYRMLVSKEINFSSVNQISCGGEKIDSDLLSKLQKSFPNAKIRNIYASTEAGSIFASEGEKFRVSDRLKNYVKIENNELYIHKNILGESSSFKLKNDWYPTGDVVEIISEYPELIFKFVQRKNEMINVGGYKVNPQEVESEILKIPGVKLTRVFGKKNSVLGNILCAEIVADNVTEKDIRLHLQKALQSFKIPRIYNFVKNIDITRTGKVKR